MGKKIKKQRGFDGLDQEVEKEFERTYREALTDRRTAFYSFIGLVLIAMLGLAIWFRQHDPGRITRTYKGSNTSLSTTTESTPELPQNDKTREIVADKDEFKFNWTKKDYDSLVIGQKSEATGDSLTDIIDKYGKPSEARAYENSDDILVSYVGTRYDKYSKESYPDRRVELYFYKNGKEYYLSRKSVSGHVVDERFQTKEANLEDFWNNDTFSKVAVGDSSTGEGGSTYEEVIELGGLPQEVNISASDGLYSHREEVHLHYKAGDASDFNQADIRLKKQEDGTFRVFTKSGEFHKDLTKSLP